MSAPRVVAVASGSAAARAGVTVGDEVLSLNGQVPRDVIQWRLLADDADVELEVRRQGRTIPVTVTKRDGEPLGAEVSSRAVRQGAHVRQPLRLLLHLPAAQGLRQ